MADAPTNAPGSFCWPELSTSDQKAAKAFYSAVFGWDANDSPIGPDQVYTMFSLGGKAVGAAYTMGAEEKQMAPPHWNSYVSVKNADETAKKAASLGGKVIKAPFDVMDAGRMAVVADPTGAFFCLWQPGKHNGVGVSGQPGTLCWTELSTRDTKAAEKFYTQLFGWTAKHSTPGGTMEYTEFSNNGVPGIGMMAMPPMVPAQVPPFWLPYFQVADVDATAAKATAKGAKVMAPPADIMGTGRFAVLNDPQGASFALFTFAKK